MYQHASEILTGKSLKEARSKISDSRSFMLVKNMHLKLLKIGCNGSSPMFWWMLEKHHRKVLRSSGGILPKFRL